MGSEITIRELRASDRRAVAFAFGHLSAQSRYQRYFTAKPELTARELRYLLDVDHWHHEALIACSPPPRAPIGIARYVRMEEFDAAELALEVVDGWQRRGVGIALLAALSERARAAGIRHFHVAMLRDNVAARALARKFGPPTQPPNHPATVLAAAGNVVELSYSLSGASSEPAGSSGPASSPPSPPTATGVGLGAGSITVSLTSASAGGSPPSSAAGQSTITVEPDGTCERRTKSASGSSM
jgi:GNAT superfamily N-acetyltransferase